MKILNRYSSLFRASTDSTQIIGHDDYQFVLKSIRVNLEKMDQEVKEEIERYGQASSIGPNKSLVGTLRRVAARALQLIR